MNNAPLTQWVSFEEAVGIIQLQTNIENPSPMLEAAVARGGIRIRQPRVLPDDGVIGPVRTVPGGLNFYRGEREVTKTYGARSVNLDDLHTWIARLKSGFDHDQPRSGAAGRPSSMNLVLEEHARRWQSGKTEASRQKEAEALEEWLHHTHPSYPTATAATIKNRLPNGFRPNVTK